MNRNGHKLKEWLDKQGKILVNNQQQTKGLWTRQENEKRTVIDYMIMDEELVPWVKALVIDDEREITTLSTDHNFLSSLINLNYTRLKWDKPQNKTWDFVSLDKTQYCTVLEERISQIPPDISNTEELNFAITKAISPGGVGLG